MNYLKSTPLLIFCALVFISCSNDDTITAPGGTTTKLSGSVQNWPNQTLIATALATGSSIAVVGTDTIAAAGDLNMDLAVPPPTILRAVVDLINDTNITISDQSAFYAAFGNLTVFDFSTNTVGKIERKNFDSNAVVGSFIVSFIYLDRACNITGTSETVAGSDTNRTQINLTLLQGWNTIYTQQTIDLPNVTGVLIASGEPAGASWRYTANPVANKLHRWYK